MGKKIFYLLFLLLSLSLSLSSCILLGSLGSITGTVTEAGSGNPIVGATVLTVPETESKITDDNDHHKNVSSPWRVLMMEPIRLQQPRWDTIVPRCP